jgi:hypothetical protein
MKIKELSLAKGKAQWRKKTAQWWPAVKGSLALVNKPCIRKGCPLCQQGKKHPAYIYSYSDQGKRRCLYVPLELVPLLERAIQNGRRLEAWLGSQGLVLIKQYRKQRDAKEL